MPNSRETIQRNTEYPEQHDEIFKALGELTSAIHNLESHSMERDKKVDEMMAKVEEMYKVFNNGSFLVSVVKWGFGTVLAVGGAYLMFKQIITFK